MATKWAYETTSDGPGFALSTSSPTVGSCFTIPPGGVLMIAGDVVERVAGPSPPTSSRVPRFVRCFYRDMIVTVWDFWVERFVVP